tara:strand:+ start:137 stop:304 length:168 start_codon:yes stop_codon:yes gene_type:complete
MALLGLLAALLNGTHGMGPSHKLALIGLLLLDSGLIILVACGGPVLAMALRNMRC